MLPAILCRSLLWEDVSAGRPRSLEAETWLPGRVLCLQIRVDQDLCTGDGLCEEIAPDVFFGMDDGLF